MKNRIKKLLAHDKLKHFFVGFFVFMAFYVFFPLWLALMAVSIIALAKEVFWDGLMKKGTPEFLDIVYTIAPGLILTLIHFWT